MIETLRKSLNVKLVIVGTRHLFLQVSLHMLGATSIERHITLDRSMWGTDQAALYPGGMRLCNSFDKIEKVIGMC